MTRQFSGCWILVIYYSSRLSKPEIGFEQKRDNANDVPVSGLVRSFVSLIFLAVPFGISPPPNHTHAPSEKIPRAA